MVMQVEYLCKDVSSIALGDLGRLISSYEQQGWQHLSELESQVVPAMFKRESEEGCFLWMKRDSSAGQQYAA